MRAHAASRSSTSRHAAADVPRLAPAAGAAPMILLDPLARRLGDRLAGTLVVHERPAEPEVVLARLPRGWSSAEAAIVESYLRRAGGLEPQRSEVLGHKLLLAMQRDDPEFLPWTDESLPALERVRRAVAAG